MDLVAEQQLRRCVEFAEKVVGGIDAAGAAAAAAAVGASAASAADFTPDHYLSRFVVSS